MYHIDLVAYLLSLVSKFSHDVVGGVVGLVDDPVHHAETVGLVFSIAVEVQKAVSIGH